MLIIGFLTLYLGAGSVFLSTIWKEIYEDESLSIVDLIGTGIMAVLLWPLILVDILKTKAEAKRKAHLKAKKGK